MRLVEVKQKDDIAIASTGPTRIATLKQIVHCLCTALETPNSSKILDEREPSYGYLISEDTTYYIYDIPYRPIQHHIATTLQDIIDKGRLQTLERKQRFSLALTIASSFVQLLQSPWLPMNITKTGIIFLDEDEPVSLDEPYVQQALVGKKSTRIEETAPIADSLDQLGIILLELCFGRRLRDQSCWGRYYDKSPAADDYILGIYDVLAARDWQDKVLGEAGPDYAAAVNWCLGGYRTSGIIGELENRSGRSYTDTGNSAIERWRKDMRNKVVGPLKMCCEYLAGRRVED